MRVFNVQAVSRPIYYDRNPTIKALTFQVSGAAPHGSVTRISYTVPAGRKAFLEAILLQLQRTAAAGTFSPAGINVDYQPSGGSLVIVDQLNEQSNVQWAQQTAAVTSFGFLGTGDLIVVQDGDGSIGGTVSFLETVKGVEFDA